MRQNHYKPFMVILIRTLVITLNRCKINKKYNSVFVEIVMSFDIHGMNFNNYYEGIASQGL